MVMSNGDRRVVLVLVLLLCACRRDGPRIVDRDGNGIIRIVCVGDSNSAVASPCLQATWCELLAERYPRWEFANTSKGFARASGDTMLWGKPMVMQGLAVSPDVVIIALGTNDLGAANLPPEAAVDAILGLRNEVLSHGLDAIVATVPPVVNGPDGLNQRIDAANALLAQRVPPEWLIDFHTGMGPTDFLDTYHLNESGQRKRAAAAEKTLDELGGEPASGAD